MKIRLRTVDAKDFDFLWKLHNLALKDYVTKVWGWDEHRQLELFTKNFKPASGRIIVVAGEDAGYLEVVERPDEIVLISIRLLPAFQNKGVGTRVIQNLIAEARRKNLSVRLQVLKINRARRLYERLGFRAF